MSQPAKSTIRAPLRRCSSFRTVFCIVSIPDRKVLKWIPETGKGRTRFESTPLSLYLRDCLADTVHHGRPGPIGGRPAEAGAALQSSLHERSSCLSVSGWIAPSATAAPCSPIRGETIARDEPRPQAIAGGARRRPPVRAAPGLPRTVSARAGVAAAHPCWCLPPAVAPFWCDACRLRHRKTSEHRFQGAPAGLLESGMLLAWSLPVEDSFPIPQYSRS